MSSMSNQDSFQSYDRTKAEFSEQARNRSVEERTYAFNHNMMRDQQLIHNVEEFTKSRSEIGLEWLVGHWGC